MTKIQVMKKNSQILCCTKKRSSAGLVPLVMLLLLCGCSVGKNVALHENAEDLQVQTVPTVSRTATQTKGFVLKEKVNLGVTSRRDFDRAVKFLNNDDFDKAIELFEKIVEISPGVTAPYINLAIAYRKIGKPGPAEEHLKTALKLFPKHPVASNEYGLLLRSAGRFTEARKVYELTIAKYPEYLPARKNLAILCDLYLNDQECAIAQYEMYSEVNPGDEQIKLWTSELRLRHVK